MSNNSQCPSPSVIGIIKHPFGASIHIVIVSCGIGPIVETCARDIDVNAPPDCCFQEDGTTDLRIMKSSPTIPTSAHDGPLPWQQDDPRPQQRGGILRPSIITACGEGAAGKERHVKRVTLQDFSRLSIGSTSSDAKGGTEADKRGRGDERLSRSGREAMEEKERLVAATGSAMSVEDVYNHSFYALPSPVTDEATHQ
jgi:hypothetical protein